MPVSVVPLQLPIPPTLFIFLSLPPLPVFSYIYRPSRSFTTTPVPTLSPSAPSVPPAPRSDRGSTSPQMAEARQRCLRPRWQAARRKCSPPHRGLVHVISWEWIAIASSPRSPFLVLSASFYDCMFRLSAPCRCVVRLHQQIIDGLRNAD